MNSFSNLWRHDYIIVFYTARNFLICPCLCPCFYYPFVVVARQLSKHTMGYLSWSGGMMSSMTSTISRNTENYTFMMQLQVNMSLINTQTTQGFHLFSFLKWWSLSLIFRIIHEHFHDNRTPKNMHSRYLIINFIVIITSFVACRTKS